MSEHVQVEEAITIDAPREIVFDLLTTADGLRAWMAVEVHSEPAPGGVIRWRHGAAQGVLWGVLLTALLILPAHSGKWTWQDKPLLLAIDTGAHLLSLMVSGLIIGVWSARQSGRGVQYAAPEA